MTGAAQSILESLDRLAEPEREEVVVEILRRVAVSEHTSPDDEELLHHADHLFLELDHREKPR